MQMEGKGDLGLAPYTARPLLQGRCPKGRRGGAGGKGQAPVERGHRRGRGSVPGQTASKQVIRKGWGEKKGRQKQKPA